MRLNAASLLVALSTLLFALSDGNAQEFEKPVRQQTVQTHHEDNLIRTAYFKDSQSKLKTV